MPIQIIPTVLPFRLVGGEGLSFTAVDGSGCWNVSYHVPIQIIKWFYLLGFWGVGGGVRAHDC